MKFHESLPTCIRLLRENGIEINERTLILRDVVGRLTVAIEAINDFDNIASVLRNQLDGYSAEPPIVDGMLAIRLLQDTDARVVETIHDGIVLTLKYIDRRLIGTDWLVGPFPKTLGSAQRLVFASIKGGVGRSTALSVLAANLALQGKRVLAIDLDLEAPGIGYMLLPSNKDERYDRRPQYGVVDYLVENGISCIDDEDLINFIGTSSFSEGTIDVIPAVGRSTDEHPAELIQKLARALIEDVSEGNITPFWKQISDMIARFEARKSYDIVLIDARAGLAEISAAPLLTLGAHILFFATDQEQTFRGYEYLISYISSQTDFSQIQEDFDWRQKITFVQSKAPATERSRARFRQNIYDLCSTWFYEQDDDDENAFSFTASEKGLGIPHDTTFVRYDPVYDAFDPTANGEQLDPDVYSGPFRNFLERVDAIITIARNDKS